MQAIGIPSEIPVIIRGKKGGTRQLLRGGRIYETIYTMTSREYGSATFRIRIICVSGKGRYGRHGIACFAYAVSKIGMETSHRLKNKCRIRTSSENLATRLPVVGIAFVPTNIWIWLIWGNCQRFAQKLFPNRTFETSFFGWFYGLIAYTYYPNKPEMRGIEL